LEYTYFMKIGQLKLSVRKNRKSGLQVPPTNVSPSVILEGEDYGLKVSITFGFSRGASRWDPHRRLQAGVGQLRICDGLLEMLYQRTLRPRLNRLSN
jgi:hypothetical protein